MKKEARLWLFLALLLAASALATIAGVAYYQQTASGRMLGGLSAVTVAFGSGACWARYRAAR